MQLSAVSTYLRQLNGNITYRCSRTQYPFNFVRIFIRILMVPRYNTLFDIAVGCSRECWHHEILIYLFYFFRNNFCFPIFVWLLNGIALKRNMFTFSQWSKRSNCKWTKNTIKRKLTIGCNTVFVAKVFHESARDCVCVCVCHIRFTMSAQRFMFKVIFRMKISHMQSLFLRSSSSSIRVYFEYSERGELKLISILRKRNKRNPTKIQMTNETSKKKKKNANKKARRDFEN